MIVIVSGHGIDIPDFARQLSEHLCLPYFDFDSPETEYFASEPLRAVLIGDTPLLRELFPKALIIVFTNEREPKKWHPKMCFLDPLFPEPYLFRLALENCQNEKQREFDQLSRGGESFAQGHV
jgi:hypothetical protein